MRQLVKRCGRAALACVLLLTAFGVSEAAAATPHCWTRGHYITPQQFGTWNNTIGHRVVCDQNVDVYAELWRYNHATRAWALPAAYSWNGSNYANGSYVNSVNPARTAPMFCGSSYMLRLYVRNRAGEQTMYDGPTQRWC